MLAIVCFGSVCVCEFRFGEDVLAFCFRSRALLHAYERLHTRHSPYCRSPEARTFNMCLQHSLTNHRQVGSKHASARHAHLHRHEGTESCHTPHWATLLVRFVTPRLLATTARADAVVDFGAATGAVDAADASAADALLLLEMQLLPPTSDAVVPPFSLLPLKTA